MENIDKVKKLCNKNDVKMDNPTPGVPNQVRSLEIRCTPKGVWARKMDITIKNQTNSNKKFAIYSVTVNPDVDGKMQVGIHAVCEPPAVSDDVYCDYKFSE